MHIFDIISCFDEFIIRYIPREDNRKTNALAQQTSSYNVTKKYFNMRKPMRARAELLVLDQPVQPVAPIDLTGPETGLTIQTAENSNSIINSEPEKKGKVVDWRVPIITYLRDPGHGTKRNIR